MEIGDRRSNAEFVGKAALECGFDMAGIAEAGRLEEEATRLREWLSRGYHASMTWMEPNPDKRTDPTLILECAKSVVSLAKNYYVPVEYPENTARISRYAWGDDYHLIVGEMLKALTAKLQEHFPNNKFVYYCDTGPVMDKAWAQRGGIGWIGKHTNLINSETGSWMFLSEVITDLVCEYDEPGVDHCGSCRACIDACPTRAIVEEYVLDANKCISFLTIENRDDTIAPGLASKLENWVFGCDICQDVCPWNVKFQKPTDEPAFSPRRENLNLKAENIHLMTREEFSKIYRRSPVKRAKYEGFRRNADALAGANQSHKE